MTAAVVGSLLLLLVIAVFDARRARARIRTLQAPARQADQRPTVPSDLLATVVEAAPMAMLVLRAAGTVVHANAAARELLFEGNDPVGENLLALIANAPAPFRDALLGDEDALFTVSVEGEAETYHLAKRQVPGESDTLTLVVVRPMTRELQREEVAVWKKLLRVISHELNNSLAPISSLAHTARKIARDPTKLQFLDEMFATIEERAAHLKSFLEGYASLARLPAPRRGHVAWQPLLTHLQAAHPRLGVGAPPAGTGWFDRGQVEQLLLNLIKNAEEASPIHAPIELAVQVVAGGHELIMRDGGPGMSPEVLQSALLPFYSTKERGTGLGLALCREIVEAHQGKIRLANRERGGLEVACYLPDASTRTPTQARLTITRV